MKRRQARALWRVLSARGVGDAESGRMVVAAFNRGKVERGSLARHALREIQGGDVGGAERQAPLYNHWVQNARSRGARKCAW